MVKHKIKPQERIKSSKQPTGRLVKSDSQPIDPQAVVKRELWQAAVDSLTQVKFVSLDAAIEAVIEIVLQEMGLDRTGVEDTKDFLFQVLKADPEVTETLREVLDITER